MEIIQEGPTLIIRGRRLSELDLFVCRVLDILTTYTPYVIVSGWLGSEKDIEDAINIREISRAFIDEELLLAFCSSFGVNV